MQIPVRNLTFYAYWCWAWIVLGVSSIAGGLYLLFVAFSLDAGQTPPAPIMTPRNWTVV